MFDNLRRSLVAPSYFYGSPRASFSGFSLAVPVRSPTIAFPVYLHIAAGLMTHPRGIPWTSHFWSVWGDFRTNTARSLWPGCIATSGLSDVRCNRRTLYRQFISHRTYSNGFQPPRQNNLAQRLSVVHQVHATCRVTHFGCVILTITFRPTALPVLAVPAVWILSPLLLID